MSIRLIARELYRLRHEVEKIEKRLEKAPSAEREALMEQLRIARAECNRMRNALDGQKDRRP